MRDLHRRRSAGDREHGGVRAEDAGAQKPGRTEGATGAPPPPPARRPNAPPARARRVTVFDRLELPASLSEFHGKLRTALEALIREQGLEVVTPPTPPRNCASPELHRRT